MASLRVTNGPSAGRRITVEADLMVGRDGADLMFEDPKMSRRHAVVRLVAGALEVEDLGSSNGTFVDGGRIDGPTRVNGGAQITCGTTVLEVQGVVTAHAGRISTAADPETAAGAPIAAFSPPARRRRRGPASRSWVPTALSFGTVIVVAAALVIYFASR